MDSLDFIKRLFEGFFCQGLFALLFFRAKGRLNLPLERCPVLKRSLLSHLALNGIFILKKEGFSDFETEPVLSDYTGADHDWLGRVHRRSVQ